MGRLFTPTLYPLVDVKTGLITAQWRRYQEDVSTALTPGAAGEVLTSSGGALVWQKLVNANIAVGAAIAYAKLALTGSIVNADIAGAAAIAWAKISKAGALFSDFSDTIAQAQKTSQATTVLTGNQDDFNFSAADSLICNNGAGLTLRGLLAGVSGQRLSVFGINAALTLANQNAGSLAANRIITTTGADAVVTRADLVYDGVTARWRALSQA